MLTIAKILKRNSYEQDSLKILRALEASSKQGLCIEELCTRTELHDSAYTLLAKLQRDSMIDTNWTFDENLPSLNYSLTDQGRSYIAMTQRNKMRQSPLRSTISAILKPLISRISIWVN